MSRTKELLEQSYHNDALLDAEYAEWLEWNQEQINQAL